MTESREHRAQRLVGDAVPGPPTADAGATPPPDGAGSVRAAPAPVAAPADVQPADGPGEASQATSGGTDGPAEDSAGTPVGATVGPPDPAPGEEPVPAAPPAAADLPVALPGGHSPEPAEPADPADPAAVAADTDPPGHDPGIAVPADAAPPAAGPAVAVPADGVAPTAGPAVAVAAGQRAEEPAAAEPSAVTMPAAVPPAAAADSVEAAGEPTRADPAGDQAAPDGPSGDEPVVRTTGLASSVPSPDPDSSGLTRAGPAPDPSPDAVQPTADGERPAAPAVAPWRRLSSAGALIWLLIALFGFTLVVQLRNNDTDQGLSTARQEDLVRILSDLEAREQRLAEEIRTLEASQRQLTSGVQGRQVALAEAEKRANELGLLAGTLPARGPGLLIDITPGGTPIKASAILNTVQELRGAGGEVMQLAGPDSTAVRVVASSSFVDAQDGVLVDGVRLRGPYRLTVIGDPQTMRTALNIPGGVVAAVGNAGGTVIPQERNEVEVTAVRRAGSLQYARPVS